MSPESKGRGFSPPARMTTNQWQDIANFFKDYLTDKPVIKWSIVLAGIGGALDAVRTLWLMVIWLSGKMR